MSVPPSSARTAATPKAVLISVRVTVDPLPTVALTHDL